jgi:hypothetical protein
VNGPDTQPIWAYLKANAQEPVKDIDWVSHRIYLFFLGVGVLLLRLLPDICRRPCFPSVSYPPDQLALAPGDTGCDDDVHVRRVQRTTEAMQKESGVGAADMQNDKTRQSDWLMG